MRETDIKNKIKGKEKANKKAKRININVGDTVVVKKFMKKNKIDTNFDPQHHQVIERSGTKVKVENIETGVVNDRYVGHLKKISSANPFFKIPEQEVNIQDKPASAIVDASPVIPEPPARPKRQVKAPTKLNEYEVYHLL